MNHGITEYQKVGFMSKEQLIEHTMRMHCCFKPGYFFSNMNSDILYNHILSHKSKDKEHICDICNMILNDSGQLSDHISKAHTLCCIVCNSSAFLYRKALVDHSKLCQSADLNDKAGITNNAGVYNDASPISLLIQALSNSKGDKSS